MYACNDRCSPSLCPSFTIFPPLSHITVFPLLCPSSVVTLIHVQAAEANTPALEVGDEADVAEPN